MAYRVVCRLCKFDHIIDSMPSLHWLRIEERIHYKIDMLVYKFRNGLAHTYLAYLLPQCQPGVTLRSLRSSTSYYMDPAFCRTSLALNGSFSSVGPWIWNSLPTSTQGSRSSEEFKSSLKTHLFFNINKVTSSKGKVLLKWPSQYLMTLYKTYGYYY